MVLYRCNNLVIDSLKMLVRDKSRALMSCNCDGVHITGLTGRLEMRNCYFDGLGDDALNIHSMAGTATRVDLESRTIKCNYSKKSPDGTLPSAWCHRGDRIRIFNSATVSYTGELTVESFNGGILTYSHLTGELCDGYTLQNIELSPSCLIESCTVKRTRAHGFLFQNNDIEVRGCRFENMSSSAILAAPDLSYWYEVGPVDGMYIHHNEFIGNGFVRPAPTISTYTSHKGTDEGICDLHKNVRIENNVFKDTPGAKILLNSADGVVIKNNVFDENKNSESVILLCCTNVESDC